MGKVLEEAIEENMEFNKDFSKELEIKMIINIVEDPTETKYDNESIPLQQTLVISTLFYRGFTKICRYNL